MRGSFLNWFLPILIFAACAPGCASIYGDSEPVAPASAGRKLTLAVMPFHSPAEARDSGAVIADILANQLYALGKYDVITPEVIARRLTEREGEPLSPQEAGAIAGAPYIVTGTVTEYTYKAGVGETPVLGVTARLIDTASGDVLWSASRAGTGGGNWFQEDSLSRLAMLVCKDMANSLNIFLEQRAAGIAAQAHPVSASGASPR